MTDIEKSRVAEAMAEANKLFEKIENRIKRSYVESLPDAMQVGKILTEIKADLPHGQFQPYVQTNFIGSLRTARRWMQLHKNRHQIKTASVATLNDAIKLLDGPKERADTHGRTIVKMADLEQNPFFDLSKIPPPNIEHWANCLRDDRDNLFVDGVPYWVFGVRRHKDKYQILCDHDKWAAMKLVGTKEAAVFIIDDAGIHVSDERMKWYLETFDYKWYRLYKEHLRLAEGYEEVIEGED